MKKLEIILALCLLGVMAYPRISGKVLSPEKEYVLQKDRVIYQWVDYFQRIARWDDQNGFPSAGHVASALHLKQQISTYGTPAYRVELKRLYHDLYYEPARYQLWGVRSVGGGPGSVNNWGWPSTFNQDPTRFPTFEESEPEVAGMDGEVTPGINITLKSNTGSDVIPQPSAQLLARLHASR